jgi:hypothetical protein
MRKAIDECIKNIEEDWVLYIQNMPDDFYQDFVTYKDEYINDYSFYLHHCEVDNEFPMSFLEFLKTGS